MAIGKNEALATRSKGIEQDLEEAERKIDAALTKPEYAQNKQVYIAVSLVPSHLWTIIENRYRDAGWKVTFQADQRDGSFWVFE